MNIRDLFHPFPYHKGKFLVYIFWIVVSTSLFTIVKRMAPRLSYLMLVATVENKGEDIVGFIYFSVTGKENEGYVANVGIFTKQELQGMKIGSKMYEILIKKAKESGISKFRVTVMEKNIPSTEQVKKLGYACKGYTEDDRWNDKREKNLIWELNLRRVST